MKKLFYLSLFILGFVLLPNCATAQMSLVSEDTLYVRGPIVFIGHPSDLPTDLTAADFTAVLSACTDQTAFLTDTQAAEVAFSNCMLSHDMIPTAAGFAPRGWALTDPKGMTFGDGRSR